MADDPNAASSLKALLQMGREVSLHELCLPHSLDRAATSELEQSVARERGLAPGAKLFRQGESFQSLYVVAKGLLKTVLADGGEVDQITGFSFLTTCWGLMRCVTERTYAARSQSRLAWCRWCRWSGSRRR